MSIVTQLSENLLEHGIKGFHRADKLWEFFTEMMGSDHAEIISAIAKDLKDALGIILVSDFVRPGLTRAEFELPFKSRQVKGWVGALENLLGHRFEDVRDAHLQVPPSHNDIVHSGMEQMKKSKMMTRFVEEEKLGNQLKRTGTLHNFKIPKDTIMAVIQKPLDDGRVKWDDQVRVSDLLLHTTLVNYGNIGGDLTLFEHLDIYLRFTVGIKPWRAPNWVNVIREKFKAARKSAAKVHHSNSCHIIPSHNSSSNPSPN